ncbi:hypothetical protein NDS46_04305 [Paenibacillus thiaminolyticus]|uniref:hypothetical protein n=1 Tax=Paenibacillus thiaminolyticus TaxID=49283 RepID=UPI00233099EF|nr:hypothetical protein [Paenibacillus thiaminolyticus]WCF09135.1 hypothetical protein NDS46_04305 [Paenibacillus thiaminolyticus]
MVGFNSIKNSQRTKRVHAFQTSENDNRNGWIGGNASAYFDELEGMINKETEMYFYLSIVNPFDDNEMISIFAPKHFEDRISKNRYPDCSLLTYSGGRVLL